MPTRLPTCIIGYVHGPVRWESVKRGDLYVNYQHFFLLVAARNEFALTHLQKRSRFGFLLMKGERWYDFVLYAWFQFRFQKQELLTNQWSTYLAWIPGTEIGTYPRIGIGRFDFATNSYERPSFYPPWFWHMD